MSWRVVVISNRAKLDYKMDYLVVRTEESVRRVHLSEISVLVLESTAISLTAYLLRELSSRKIDVLFCDEKRLPYGMLHTLYGSHDTSLKLRMQIKWEQEIKDFVWAEIVRAKISGQAGVLEHLGRPQTDLLRTYLREIVPGDKTNREGHAAKVYFNALFGMEFSRSAENGINAALNYGYSIFLSVVAREITACGYATQLGIFHENMFNAFNLASDLMEPFRPFVDLTVARMKISEFDSGCKIQLMQVLNKVVTVNGKTQYMLNAVKLYVRSVFEALNEKDISLIDFVDYELQIYEDDIIL